MNKNKSKNNQIPKPIKIKKEKSEEERTPQPMAFYIDDRLEMIKQVFGTLKPKTILNLAPDFLKTKNLEDIEEACLHELLCISTKRLRSIINDTKCPTDTESSDDDSDVQRQDAHISLEEISSDSELEDNSSKKAKKNKTLNGTDANTTKQTHKSSQNDTDGQISVLELLELQARARAIRSQLALEPVTKIEVESGDEKTRNPLDDHKNNDKVSNKSSHRRSRSEHKRQPSEKKTKDMKKDEASRATAAVPLEASSPNNTNNQSTVKKVKLKRNYRRSSAQVEANVKEEAKQPNTSADKLNKIDMESIKESTLVKQEKEKDVERSSSPDVIPIVAEPETLCIDSSDNEENKGDSVNTVREHEAISNEHITMRRSNVVEQNSEPEEGEIEEDSYENDTEKVVDSNETAERVDDNIHNEEAPPTHTDNNNDNEEQTGTENAENNKINNSSNNIQECKLIENVISPSEENLKPRPLSPSLNTNATETLLSTGTHDEYDDDQNDDVISLEGGDLESEMIEHLQNETSNPSTSSFIETKSNREEITLENKLQQNDSERHDIISLDSSEDDRSKDAESWRSRYMRSSKVNKVLLASRLGKRVRDKITESKRSQKEDIRYNTDIKNEKSTVTFTSRHEDGSVKQYKELLELLQRNES